ncbi:MAG: tetratricopeptide repeat protein [Chitinophagaceae bacterium]|nr:tetratricopeptide repeat protein [Chitinophagaceae bacterium]
MLNSSAAISNPFRRIARCITLFITGCTILLSLAYPQAKKIDSIRELLKSSGLPDSQRIAHLNQLAFWLNRDSTNEALVYANEAYLLALKTGNKPAQITSLLNLSEGYLYNDSYEQSLEYAFTTLDLSRSLSSDPDIANAYTNLGWIFYDTENGNYALQYHRNALELYQKTGIKAKQATALNAIGLVFQLKNEYDSARKYFDQSLQMAQAENLPGTISAAYNNIGICENARGRYTEAVNFFRKALEIESKRPDAPLSQAETLNQMAYSMVMLKNYPEAEAILKQSRTLIENASSNTKKEKLLDNLNISSQLYQALGNYKQAFTDLQEYTNVRNQIVTRNKSDAVAALKTKKETQEKETELKELAAEKQLRAFQRNVLALCIVLIIIIGLLFYSKLKQKQRKEKELEEIKQALIRKDLDNTLLEKAALQDKLKYKDAELKNYALFISQRNELVRSFIDDLSDLKLEGDGKKESQTRFNKMMQKFQHDLDINKEAQDFNLSVDEIHKDFFFNLLQKYPELTENERRLCAQIRLNLSIKDIASLNNISVKSAEMARYRLRKQFSLEHGDNLNDFLKQF